MRAWSLLSTIAVLSMARAALADAPPAAPENRSEGSAYVLAPEIDVPVMAISTVVGLSWFMSSQFAPPWCAPVCDRNTLPGIDRWAAGRYDRTWAAVSNIGLATMLVSSAAVVIASEGLGNGINDEIVVVEAALVSDALAVISNLSMRRPRPFAYGDTAPLDARMNGNAAMSFFSGHTTTSTAIAISTFRTFRRLNRPVLSWIVLGVGTAGATLVGTSRVLAGDHFPTDVAVGAVVGASNGVLVPALHNQPIRVVPAPVGATGSGLIAVGAF